MTLEGLAVVVDAVEVVGEVPSRAVGEVVAVVVVVTSSWPWFFS